MEKNEIYSVGLDMIYLASCSLHGRIPEKEKLEKIPLELVYKLAKRHLLQAIIYVLLVKCREKYGEDVIDKQLFAKWRAEYYTLVKRILQFDAERQALCGFMDEQGIWYLCMKGVVLQHYYPEIGMRQMADNDILVDKKACAKICNFMTKRGYSCESFGKGCHDTYLKGTLNFEIHRQLFPDMVKTKRGFDYYRNVESRLLKKQGSFERTFSDEDFYVYFLYHAYKHYVISGFGARTLMDIFLYVSKNEGKLKREYLKGELEKIGLSDFDRDICALSFKLFSAEALDSGLVLDEKETKMLEYILLSGSFGTKEHHVKNAVSDISGGEKATSWVKFKYLWKRVFPGMEYYRSGYPRASKFIVTIPFIWLARIFRGIFKRKMYVSEVKYLNEIDKDKAD